MEACGSCCIVAEIPCSRFLSSLATARAGQPRAMFAGSYTTAPADTYWDASPDGNRFVFVREEKRAPDRLVVLMNAIPRKR